MWANHRGLVHNNERVEGWDCAIGRVATSHRERESLESVVHDRVAQRPTLAI